MLFKKLTIAATALFATTMLAGFEIGCPPLGDPGNPGKTGPNEEPQSQSPDQAGSKAVEKEKMDRERSRKNLEKIADAVIMRGNDTARYNPIAIYSVNGQPLLSWRVMILPYIGEWKLYSDFKLDEPWDSDHNKKLLVRMPSVYAPVRGQPRESFTTYYQVFVGKGAAFEEGAAGLPQNAIKGRKARTIAIVEAADAVPWTKPADLTFLPGKPLPKLGGLFKDVFHAAFFDGSVHTLKKELDENVLRIAISRDREEGTVFDWKKIEADK